MEWPAYLVDWLRIALVYGLLFGWLPGRLVWRRNLDTDGWCAAVLLTGAVIVAAVHALVVSRIFSLPAFLLVVALLLGWRWLATRPAGPFKEVLTLELHRFYDDLEGGWGDRLARRWRQIRLPSWRNWPEAAVLAVTFAAALYLRLAWPLAHPAPPLSDTYVHISWLKHLGLQVLYPDGAYPIGMHTLVAPVLLFTGIEAMDFLRWAGPLHNWLIVVSIFFFAWRVTGQRMAGALGAFLYGAGVVQYAFERQAAALPQEFSLALILPAVWLAYRYLMQGDRLYLGGAAAAAGLAAAMHPITALFVAMGLAAAGLALWLSRAAPFLRVLALGSAGAAMLALGVAPVLLSPLLGVPLYGTGMDFLAGGEPALPDLTREFWLAAGLGSLSLPALFLRAIPPAQRLALAFAAGSAAIYLLPYMGVRSEALSTRVGDYLAVSVAATAPLVWGWLLALLQRLRSAQALSAGLTAALLVAIWTVWPPSPAAPYSLQTDEMVRVVRTIMDSRPDGTYLLVSGQEEFAVVLGRGYHYLDRFWAEQAVAEQQRIFLQSGDELRPVLSSRVYFFLPTEPAPGVRGFTQIFADKEQATAGLRAWLAEYGPQLGDRLRLYHDSDDLQVWVYTLPN